MVKGINCSWLASALALLSCSSLAVEPLFQTPADAEPTFVDKAFDFVGADGGFDPDKGVDMSYIPSVFYNPEQEFGGGALIIGLYKADSAMDFEQPSSFVVNAYVSTNLSVGVTFDNITFLNNGNNRFEIDAEIHDEPVVYYGRGYDSTSVDDNKVLYTETLVTLTPRWYHRMADNWFVGLGGNITYVDTRDPEVGDEVNNGGNPILFNDLESNTSAGGFVTLLYDSRNYVENTERGTLLQADFGAYYSDLNSDSFGKYDIELAHFIDLEPVPGVLALQGQGKFTSGNVPWNKLPDLGGAYSMRGYILGRYRDEQMAMVQAEYRLPIYRRWGSVFWAGLGSIGEDVDQLSDDVLTTYGLGLRYRLKGRINLRADLGFGEDETLFYFNVNEVF
ncbi:hypothetical protein [Vibrio breoganii]|uniref:hypothetical protein n=1 Tax=Vibrio breoganii TaxID=553239 RepID=UPI000C81B4DB|nr:hypothetical protein [Vibrio breoganii]PMG97061.1 hypothetical protein BCU80_04100 [Vibrio breoganii]PMM16999.1 hypothetical protein BCT59_15270 [Vibrio breoganii]